MSSILIHVSHNRDDDLQARARELESEILNGRNPREAAEDFRNWLVSNLDAEERTALEETMRRKHVEQRFSRHASVVANLVVAGNQLVVGDTFEERVAEYLALVGHVRALWGDARLLFECGRFTSATFLAIACIEEAGKVGVAKWQVYAPALLGHPGTNQPHSAMPSLKKHPAKHLLAAGQGALINHRVDRLFGVERIEQFLADVDGGRIEQLRQSCLYADRIGDRLCLPRDVVQRSDALFYVALAGEIMAEILGAIPDLWTQLLDDVREFEERNGLRGE